MCSLYNSNCCLQAPNNLDLCKKNSMVIHFIVSASLTSDLHAGATITLFSPDEITESDGINQNIAVTYVVQGVFEGRSSLITVNLLPEGTYIRSCCVPMTTLI